ncbi:DUF262 domain-containing protein [candidate division KSB1 bacterium]|nr:DUF262 domain-containing protein [candidate division KSB1 bacterium]
MKNQQESIRKMVAYLNNEAKDGGYWLPNIQRPFVWKEDQIERLFDSIMREYPISTLLVWRTKMPIRHRKFIDNYKHGLKLTDFYVPENEKSKLLILDGQQRLQSMFIGLRGSYNKKELYLDILSGDLVAPDDIRYKFKFKPSDSTDFPWIKFKDIVFSNEKPNKFTQNILSRANEDVTGDKEERISDNIWQIFRMFREEEIIVYQELDSVDNPEAYSENDVVEIFIRANSGGTKLGKSDLLFSLLTSTWEDADEHMEELIDELNRSGYEFTRDFVLKTCLTLLGKGARYDVAKFRDGTTKEAIIDNWNKISQAIKDVKDFLIGKTFIRTDKALPSYLGLIPVIYFRYNYPENWKEIDSLDTYILRTLITGAFSGTPDNLIDKCTRLIDEDEEFDINQLFGIIRADGRNLDITKDTILNLHYGSKDIHLLFNFWYKDFNYIPSYENNLPQIDHIFPQSLLKRIKDLNPESGRMNILRYKAPLRDQIANCMLLTAEENGAGGKGNTPPDIWFGDKPESYLDKHLIPRDTSLWQLDRYEDFIEERKKMILDNFSFMLQEDD